MPFALKEHCSDYSLGVYSAWVNRQIRITYLPSNISDKAFFARFQIVVYSVQNTSRYHFSLLKIYFSVYWKQQLYLVQDVLAKVEPGSSCTP